MRFSFVAPGLALIFSTLVPGATSARPSAAQDALCTAAQSGTAASIAAAIAKGGKVNGTCTNTGSGSPLGTALTVNNLVTLEALIAKGANPVGVAGGYVPLGYVRSVAAARILLKHGAKVNLVGEYGPPLSTIDSTLASSFDDFSKMTEQDAVDIASLLIANGANVRYANKIGDTALTAAAFACLPKLTAFLLDHGANVNALTAGQTSLTRVRTIKSSSPGPCGATEQVLLAHGGK